MEELVDFGSSEISDSLDIFHFNEEFREVLNFIRYYKGSKSLEKIVQMAQGDSISSDKVINIFTNQAIENISSILCKGNLGIVETHGGFSFPTLMTKGPSLSLRCLKNQKYIQSSLLVSRGPFLNVSQLQVSVNRASFPFFEISLEIFLSRVSRDIIFSGEKHSLVSHEAPSNSSLSVIRTSSGK